MIDGVLTQIGPVNMSRHHLTGYKKRPVTLKRLLTYIVSPTKFKSRRAGVPATGYYKFFVIDWDGDKMGAKETASRLRAAGISYIAVPSPSHWLKKPKEYRMRLLIPLTGALAVSKEGYEAQYLAFLVDIELPIPDKTASDTKRLFYPPLMKGIKQVPSANPKPTDQKRKKALKLITAYLGKRYKLRRIQEAMELAAERFPKVYGKEGNIGKWKRSERKPVYLHPKTIISLNGKEIGTFKKLALTEKHYRCDCPFDDAQLHADGQGFDYAFLQGGKILCEGHTHDDVIARLDDPALGLRLSCEDT